MRTVTSLTRCPIDVASRRTPRGGNATTGNYPGRDGPLLARVYHGSNTSSYNEDIGCNAVVIEHYSTLGYIY